MLRLRRIVWLFYLVNFPLLIPLVPLTGDSFAGMPDLPVTAKSGATALANQPENRLSALQNQVGASAATTQTQAVASQSQATTSPVPPAMVPINIVRYSAEQIQEYIDKAKSEAFQAEVATVLYGGDRTNDLYLAKIRDATEGASWLDRTLIYGRGRIVDGNVIRGPNEPFDGSILNANDQLRLNATMDSLDQLSNQVKTAKAQVLAKAIKERPWLFMGVTKEFYDFWYDMRINKLDSTTEKFPGYALLLLLLGSLGLGISAWKGWKARTDLEQIRAHSNALTKHLDAIFEIKRTIQNLVIQAEASPDSEKLRENQAFQSLIKFARIIVDFEQELVDRPEQGDLNINAAKCAVLNELLEYSLKENVVDATDGLLRGGETADFAILRRQISAFKTNLQKWQDNLMYTYRPWGGQRGITSGLPPLSFIFSEFADVIAWPGKATLYHSTRDNLATKILGIETQVLGGNPYYEFSAVFGEVSGENIHLQKAYVLADVLKVLRAGSRSEEDEKILYQRIFDAFEGMGNFKLKLPSGEDVTFNSTELMNLLLSGKVMNSKGATIPIPSESFVRVKIPNKWLQISLADLLRFAEQSKKFTDYRDASQRKDTVTVIDGSKLVNRDARESVDDHQRGEASPVQRTAMHDGNTRPQWFEDFIAAATSRPTADGADVERQVDVERVMPAAAGNARPKPIARPSLQPRGAGGAALIRTGAAGQGGTAGGGTTSAAASRSPRPQSARARG